MRVLITGGSGFIGTNLVDYYARAGNEVINVDIATPRCLEQYAFWFKCDLLDRDSLIKLVDGCSPELVIHMGARTDLRGGSVTDYSANTEGVANLLGALKGSGSLRRAIFASSRLVCRIGHQPSSEEDYCPSTAYGESKVIGEKLVRQASLEVPWIIVRPTSIWGPWFHAPYRSFFEAVSRGVYLHPRGRRIRKSFGFVGNAVFQLDCLAKAESSRVSGRMFYIADYDAIDVGEMANKIQKELNAPSVRELDEPVLRVLARCGDLLKQLGWKDPPLTSFRLNNLLAPMIYDLGALEELTGPLPYNLDEGIRLTARWLSDACA